MTQHVMSNVGRSLLTSGNCSALILVGGSNRILVLLEKHPPFPQTHFKTSEGGGNSWVTMGEILLLCVLSYN